MGDSGFTKFIGPIIVLIIIVVLLILILPRIKNSAKMERDQNLREKSGVGRTPETKASRKDVRSLNATARKIARTSCPYPKLSRKYRQCKRALKSQIVRGQLEDNGSLKIKNLK